MTQIKDDAAFKKALDDLSPENQRKAAARFVVSVLDLTEDSRLQRVKELTDETPEDDERDQLVKSLKRAALDSHTRCGAEGDWAAQAEYFVARAAIEAVAPAERAKPGNPAWKTAAACRMARTAESISGDEAGKDQESKRQHQILTDMLAA